MASSDHRNAQSVQNESPSHSQSHNKRDAGIIDWNTFTQILEMDDDEEAREFSAGLVSGFCDQAEATFNQMDEAIESKNLEQLSSLGHFLKGSSAALGVHKVQNECEKIQNLGAHKDETGVADVSDDTKCLESIKVILANARVDYEEAKQYFKSFYNGLL